MLDKKARWKALSEEMSGPVIEINTEEKFEW